MWRKGVLSRRNSLCKGPGAGLCLACWRNSEEACVAEADWVGWGGREEGKGRGPGRSGRALGAIVEDMGFSP